jgi:hypothetical protein
MILYGVATVAVVGGSMIAVSSFAQSDINGPQYSSPAERAETQQLNEQNLDGATQSPAALNGEAYDADNGASSAQYDGQAQYNAQQGQYGEQMQQYQNQQQQYQQQRAQYDNQQQRYYNNIAQYDQAQWNYDYPRAYAYDYNGAHIERLDYLAEPSQQLAQVPVEGPNGVWVGRIRNIEISADGSPMRVEVSLNRRVSVWVDPQDLRFNPDEHVAYTDLSREDLWHLPGATVESGPM